MKKTALAAALAAVTFSLGAHAQLGLKEGPASEAPSHAAGGAFKNHPMIDSYKNLVARHVSGFHKHAGSKGGYRNLTAVGYTVDRSGVVTDTWVVRSSGDSRLDEHAVGVFKRAFAKPLPAPPAAIFGNESAVHFTEAFIHTSDGGWKLQTLSR